MRACCLTGPSGAPARWICPRLNDGERWSWARDIAWNLDHAGHIRDVLAVEQEGVDAPTTIEAAFQAPHRGDEVVLLAESFQKALATELQRLSQAGGRVSGPTPWP